MLQAFAKREWTDDLPNEAQQTAINSLEQGQILYFPELSFTLTPEETHFLSPDYADPHSKNISYHPEAHKLCGTQHLSDNQHAKLKSLLSRFSRYALGLIQQVLPQYSANLIVARTSFRPVEISNRKTSYRKDDKRLHVDAFPSAPNQGKRILRVFSNINPQQTPRVWRVGESFESVANRFLPGIPKPFPGSAAALRFLHITKSYRTRYDHYMLQIHDRMKADDDYQKNAKQSEIAFPAGSSWIVQTDDVSHAAMSGQHVLEQTFYLPVTAMQNATCSPLSILEKILQEKLV